MVHQEIVTDVVLMLPTAPSLASLRQVSADFMKVSLHKILIALEKSDMCVVSCICSSLTPLFAFIS